MALFKKAEFTQAYLKAGIMGLQGSGKTLTGTLIAIGMANLAKERNLSQAGKPIFFLDSETGSDYMEPRIKAAGHELYSNKSRAFTDLVPSIREAEKEGSVLVIDSITHFWRELCETYRKRKNLRKLEFHHWNDIKGGDAWGAFTDAFVNSPLHIIMCGRLGYEYDTEVDEETNKKTIVKSDVKMKAEGETGYEPSLLIMMERELDMRTNKQSRRAYILKDRFDVIDGATFLNPTFENFLPHIERLNHGGTQLGVDTTRTSEGAFGPDGDARWAMERRQKQIALEEIQEEIVKMYPGQTAGDKKGKADLIEQLFSTRSWTAVESKHIDVIRTARNRLWLISRGHEYGAQPPEKFDEDVPMGDAPTENAA